MSSNSGTAPSGGNSLGQKVRGAFEAAQGLGDGLRFGAMDFVDSVTGTGPHEKGGAAAKGAQKTEQGIHRMEHGGRGPPASQPNDPASGVVTVDDIYAQRAAGDYRYGAPEDPRSESA